MRYRSLCWWSSGWYSMYQWEQGFWQADDFGNAVVIERDTLRFFNNIDIGVF